MEFALPTVLAALAAFFVRWWWRARRRHQEVVSLPPAVTDAEHAVIVLDLDGVDAQSESVQRLVREAGARAMVESPDLSEVIVHGRAGQLLGRVVKGGPLPTVSYPPSIMQPHVVHRVPEPPGGLEDEVHPMVVPRFEPRERHAPKRPLADSFAFPTGIRSRIADPEDPVEMVRAILDVSGRPAAVDGDVIRSGDDVVVVVRPETAGVVLHDALNHAYIAFRESGAARGLVISFGYLDPMEVRRREFLAPSLRHAGSKAIQRMADAVVIGADPIAFATGAPVVATARREAG